MSFTTIQKRIQRAVLGTAVGGALVFTQMAGCDPAAGGNPVAKGMLDAARISATGGGGASGNVHRFTFGMELTFLPSDQSASSDGGLLKQSMVNKFTLFDE
jgi:hypothetical protein